MKRSMNRYVLSVGILLLSIQPCLAQTPPTLLAPISAPPSPASYLGPIVPLRGSTAVETLEDRNGPSLIGNPLLDGPDPGRLGWFGTVEIDLLSPNVNNGLRNFVTIGPTTTQIALPSASLNWTVGPRFELGYRLGEGAGELLATYRFILASGSDTTANFDPAGNAGALRSQLNFHIIDLDYASQENSLLPTFEMKWRAGVRLASLFFDSTDTSPLLQERVANSFFGAGPHIGLDLWHPIIPQQLSLYCRLDSAGVLGQVRQSFSETTDTGAGPLSGYTRQTQFDPTVSVMIQAGLAWTPTERCRVTVGYSYEHWWDVGFAGAITQPPTFSRADITIQGLFLRGEWKF